MMQCVAENLANPELTVYCVLKHDMWCALYRLFSVFSALADSKATLYPVHLQLACCYGLLPDAYSSGMIKTMSQGELGLPA